MASIESTLGKVSSSNSPQIKKYVVDQPQLKSNEQFEQELIQETLIDSKQALKQAEDFKKNTEVAITKEKKSKLELLLGLKKSKKSIIIEGHNIVLQNLSSGDMKTAYKKIANQKLVVDQMFDTRHIFLAFSLYSFDGELISNLLGDDDDLDTRISLIENMSEEVVKEIYEFYNNSFELIHPKSEEQFSEVTADIKK